MPLTALSQPKFANALAGNNSQKPSSVLLLHQKIGGKIGGKERTEACQGREHFHNHTPVAHRRQSMDACRGIDANLGCGSEAERAERASAGSCASPKSGPSSCASPLCGCCSRLASSCVTSNASAASTTSHLSQRRPSRGPPSSAPRASICQRFFFEELRTCLGEEQASQWLLKNQPSTPLTDKHKSPPPLTMLMSATLPNLQAGEKAAAHAPVVVMHGKCYLPPLIGQAGGGVCRGAGDVVSVSSLARRARARVKDVDSVGLMFTDAAHLVLGPRTPSE